MAFATFLSLNLLPTTRPYAFDEGWAAADALPLEELRDISALRRKAANPEGSSLFGNPVVTTENVVEDCKQYVERLGQFCNEASTRCKKYACFIYLFFDSNFSFVISMVLSLRSGPAQRCSARTPPSSGKAR